MNCRPSPSLLAIFSKRHGRPWGALAVGGTLSLVLGGCNDIDSDPVSRARMDTTAVGSTIAPLPPCESGTEQACSLLLGEHEGLLSCYEGMQVCEQGQWGECGEGFEFSIQKRQLTRSALQSLAFSDPAECTDNPCNRYCREFIEAPTSGIFADEDPDAELPPQLLTGGLSDYPLETLAIGNNAPCQEAADCQFNTRCTDPAVGSCAHSVCREGEALSGSCNRCAAQVCEADDNCCGTAVTCGHDPCQTGSPLDATCDTCVEAICADGEHPECCDTSETGLGWTSACAAHVATYCAPLGQTCGCPDTGILLDGTCYQPNGTKLDWNQAVSDAFGCPKFGDGWRLAEPKTEAENNGIMSLFADQLDPDDPGVWTRIWLGSLNVNSVAGDDNQWVWDSDRGDVFYVGDADGSLQAGHEFENWAATRPEAGADGQVVTMSPGGLWSNASNSGSLESICSGPPNVLTPPSAAIRWDQTCVDLARSECGVNCPDTAPLGLGACTSQVPSRLDGDCETFDLSVGATCDDSGTAQIPICNHGLAAAPAGLSIRFFEGSNTDLMGSIDPDLSTATDCTLSEAVPPGRCVIVDDCAGIEAGDAIVVNLVSDAPDNSECRFDDNWSIYEPIACQAPLCEATVRSAQQVAQLNCVLPIENPLDLDVDASEVRLDTGIPEPGCADGEVRWGNSCYFFETELLNWNSARSACTARGTNWDLIAINTESENDFARAGFGGLLPDGEFHIGLNDQDNEGEYVWSNGSCDAYQNFSQDESGLTGKGIQPNDDTFGDVQDCTRMFADDAWGDTSCSALTTPYVCEGPIQNAPGGCAPGQVTGPDGDCYVVDTTLANWDEANAACKSIGTGWGLAHIRTNETNDFAISLTGCAPTWLNRLSDNFSDSAFDQQEILPGSVDFGQDPFIDETGSWRLTASDPAALRLALCQGPSLAVGNPPLTQVSSAAACTTDSTRQYYFNGDFFGGTGPDKFAPESLELCPATCTAAGQEPGTTRLTVDIPCGKPSLPSLETVYDDIFYEAECSEGGNQWDFLYYDAVTPGDSRIEFEVRTGRTQSVILADSDAFTAVASAHAVPTDTQRCEIDPVNGCPIDLFSLLDNPGFQREVLQLRIRLIPGSNGEGPLLRDWKVRYSCPPSE